MAEGSSLPPLKTNKGKYGLVLLVLIGTCAGGWLYVQRSEESETLANAAEPAVPAPAPDREQFTAELEIPEEVLAPEGADDDTPVEPAVPDRSREPIACNGSLEASEIRAAINGAPRKQVQNCYEQRLKEDNLLQGQMKVLLTIAPNGEVRSVSVSGSLGDAAVYSCVKRVARTWKFPQPEGGCVRTAVPFTLTPKL